MMWPITSMSFATIPMDQFPLKWRFTDSRHQVLPSVHLARVKPLARFDAERLWTLIAEAGIHDEAPFSRKAFPTVVSLDLKTLYGNPDGDRVVRAWLYERNRAFNERVWLSYQPHLAIETSWRLVLKYWSAFYYPASDDLTVVDGTFEWALLFHHELKVFFGSGRTTRAHTTKSEEG